MCSTPLLSLTAKHHLHEARSIVCTHGLEILQTWATYQVIESYIVATRLGQKWQNATLPPGLKRCQRLCVSRTWDTGQSMQLLPSRNCPSAYSSVQSETSTPDKPKICGTAGCKHIRRYIHCFFCYFLSIFPDCLYFFLCFIHPLDMSWKKWLEDSISFQDNQLNSIIILKGRVYLLSRKWAWNARVVNPHESWVSDCTKKRLALKAICGHKHTSGETIDHVKRGWQYVHAWNILKHQTTGMANMAWHHLAPIHCPVALPLGTSRHFRLRLAEGTGLKNHKNQEITRRQTWQYH